MTIASTVLLITLNLLIPPASKGTLWDIGEVQNQVQITFESGVQASYPAKMVPCGTQDASGWTIFETKEDMPTCYLVNTEEPAFVRSPWTPITRKTFKGD